MRRIILIFLIALSHTSFSQDKSIIFSSEINLETKKRFIEVGYQKTEEYFKGK